MRRRKSAATKADAEIIKSQGGLHFEDTSFTKEQYESLVKYYSFNCEHKEKYAESAILAAQKRYERGLKEHKEGKSGLKPIPPDLDKIRRENELFFEACDFRDIMRATTHDGRRLMAFIVQFLAQDEDPVEFVAMLMSEYGFDINLG